MLVKFIIFHEMSNRNRFDSTFS